jgi:aminoglycoside phosphotransferase (APT) family kinase protein
MSRSPIDDARVTRAVRRHLGDVAGIADLHRLSGGASRETWAFDVVRDDGGRHNLILRRDPGPAIGEASRATEYELVRAAQLAGVPVPTVRFLLDEDDALGSGFVMDRVEGATIPRKILRDDTYADARSVMTGQCADIAAEIHAVELSTLPKLATLGAVEQIAQHRAILDGFGEPHPAFELGLRWLEQHAPEPSPPGLVHGDFRLGNFIVGPEGIRAVLDWELAHLGDPIEDLGWLCVKSWRFGNVQREAGGFGDADELLERYGEATGTTVPSGRLRYWQVLGTVKWGVICELQCFSHLNGQVRSVELAALGRRVAEMEWDLLELIG